MTIQIIIDSKFNNRGVKQAEGDLRRLINTTRGLGDIADALAQGPGAGSGMMQFLDPEHTAAGVERMVSGLQQAATQLDHYAAQALNAGDATRAMDLIGQANNARSLADEFGSLIPQTESFGDRLGNLLVKFNQFGFTAFITIATLRQLAETMQHLWEVAEEGAGAIDRLTAFNELLPTVGVSAQELRRGLEEAAQGAITFDEAMGPALQLMRSGLPQAAARADDLLKIATNAAILSGNIEKTDEIYAKLIRGIVRGSPRLIDDADIIIKLGDAYGRFANQVGATGDDLNEFEQRVATLNAVLEEGERINDLADGFDSLGLGMQRVETDLAEAGDALKMFFADQIGEGIEAAKELSATLREVGIGLLQLQGYSEDAANSIANMFDSFSEIVQIIVIGADVIGNFAGILRDLASTALIPFKLIDDAIRTVIAQLNVLKQVFTGALDPSEALVQIKANFDAFNQELIEQVNILGRVKDAIAESNEETRDWMERFGMLPEVNENLAAMGDELARLKEQAALREELDAMNEQLEAAIEARTGIEAQFRDRSLDLEEDYADKMADIHERLSERLADINENLREKLLDINEQFLERSAKIAEDTAEKLQDIDESLAENLAEISEDAAEKRADAKEKHDEKLEDLEEDHQKKINEIMRRFELARLKALIDRDARALFEAEQRKKEELKALSEGEKEKREDIKDEYKDTLEEIEKQENKRREELIKQAEKRRQDALEAQAEQLEDLKKAREKQRREAKEQAAKQRAEAKEDFNKSRMDAREHYQESLRDLDEWYQDQLAARMEANLRQKIAELEHLAEMQELTQEHLDELRGMWSEYNDFVGGQSSGMPPGSSGAPGGATTGGGVTLDDLGLPTPPQPPIMLHPPGAVTHNRGSNRVNINITNDKTLQQIFKEMSYEATLDVIEGER